MNRTEKEKALGAIQEVFRDSKSAFLVNYTGLKVVVDTELRRQIEKLEACDYRVLKNTLAMRAAKSTRFEPLSEHFQGPVAVAYSKKDEGIALAKLLLDFSKANPAFKFKAGIIEGRVIPADQIQEVAKLPSREGLISKLLFLMNSPTSRVLGVLTAPVRNLVSVLKQIQK